MQEGIRYIVLWVLFFFTGISFSNVEGQEILFAIDGEPVIEEEFVFFMKQNRALTYSYFYTNYKADQGPEFWSKSYSGENPLIYIRDKTITRLIEVKMHLMLARDMGLMDDISFIAFLTSLEKENISRKEKSESGEVIYGPEQYTGETFFSYWYSNLVISLMKKWREENQVGKDSLLDYYQRNGSDFTTAGEITVNLVSIQYNDEEEMLEAEVLAEKIISGQGAGDPCNQPGTGCEELILSGNENIEAEGHVAEMYRIARELEPGQAGGPVRDAWSKQVIFVICKDKKDGYIQPFEEVEHMVKQQYLDLQFERIIDDRIKNADVRIQSNDLDGILLKYLN